VPPFRYPQFCALARAAELLGERWTLLVLRELLLGPKRFSALRAGLRNVSSSVLAQRLASLEQRGLVRGRRLDPPAGVAVYELTESALALRPALTELTRWGARFLIAPLPGDQVEPDWLRAGLPAFARRTATPPRSFLLRAVSESGSSVAVHVAGGRRGTRVSFEPLPADATLTASTAVLLGVVSGRLETTIAERDGLVAIDGDHTAVSVLPLLFDVPSPQKGDIPWPSSTARARRPSSAKSGSSSPRRGSRTS
jgi:DNA-binding HxlR family transcriptional regulator